MSSVHKNPTEESFIAWVTNNPESFHPLDMKRFYTFAHNVFSYRSKRWLDKSFFQKQIKLHSPMFKQENIDLFYERLLICKEYHYSYKTQLIDDDGSEWYEIRVRNHKIESEPISDIRKYLFKSKNL